MRSRGNSETIAQMLNNLCLKDFQFERGNFSEFGRHFLKHLISDGSGWAG